MKFKLKIVSTGTMKAPKLTTAEYRALGEEIVAAMKRRLARGINNEGNPAYPLSDYYARIKAKIRRTRHPIRDLHLTGMTLNDFQVRRAWGGIIRAGPQLPTARKRALLAQLIDPLIGFTDYEQRAVVKRVRQLYGRKITAIFEKA